MMDGSASEVEDAACVGGDQVEDQELTHKRKEHSNSDPRRTRIRGSDDAFAVENNEGNDVSQNVPQNDTPDQTNPEEDDMSSLAARR